jgi:hypothetical protein
MFGVFATFKGVLPSISFSGRSLDPSGIKITYFMLSKKVKKIFN